MREALQKLHDAVDEMNASGVSEFLCGLCFALEYGTVTGIEHSEECPLLIARRRLGL